MSDQHRLTFPFQARYRQLGEITSNTRHIVFALHGHGQLAEFFIRKFSPLNDGQTVIYAPEGLSRYYLEGFTGRVGATWMTREDRENDILNYITYLNTLCNQEKTKWPEDAVVHVLGFSQGAATATRWVLDGEIKAHRLILWAGILPYDMDMTKGRNILQSIETVSVCGTRDPYLTDKTSDEMTQLAKKAGADFTYHTFDGEHVIEEQMLRSLFNRDAQS